MPAIGKAMWRELVGLLAPTGVLDRADRYQLELLCETYCDVRRLTKESRKEGASDSSFRMLTSARESLRKLLMETGLTPAARSKLGILQAKGDTLTQKLADILEGGD